MKQILLILFFMSLLNCKTQSQSFTAIDLLTLADMPSKKIVNYMLKKGFVLSASNSDNFETRASFIQQSKPGKQYIGLKKSIEICIKDDSKYLTLSTCTLNEYLEGQQSLIKSGFFYDTQKDLNKETSMLFQKANITVKASSLVQDSTIVYSFYLKERVVPSSLRYAEELLQFDSHEFLTSFFGAQNVKNDMYYFSEKELKKCSVLFSGTKHQAVFVWEDEVYLNNLAYIIITNVLPTEGAKNNSPFTGNNEWQLRSGVYSGMGIKDLLKINETDFEIYGNKSELAFLVKPNEYGKIDFKKTAIMLSCHECFDNKIFNQNAVSALNIAKANLPMRVFDIVLYPLSR